MKILVFMTCATLIGTPSVGRKKIPRLYGANSGMKRLTPGSIFSRSVQGIRYLTYVILPSSCTTMV